MEEESERRAAVQKAEEEKKERRDRFKDCDEHAALAKVVKHMGEPKKFGKCLKMAMDLVENFDFDGHTLFNLFDAVMKIPNKYSSEETKTQIEQLYFLLLELSEQGEDGASAS